MKQSISVVACVVLAELILAGCVALGQAPLAFEVASIKANPSGGRGSWSRSNKGEWLMHMNLKRLVESAYDVRDYSYSGPDWLDSLYFNITAKLPEGSTSQQRPEMLRTLLAERFKLKVHRESRTLTGYALVPAKGGFKLKAVPDEGQSTNSNGTRLEGKGVSMKSLADFLARTLNQPVMDQTAIPGVFNLTLEYAAYENQPLSAAADAKPADSTGPSIFTALQEQLGLRLIAAKVPLEIVVVDHVERTPTEN